METTGVQSFFNTAETVSLHSSRDLDRASRSMFNKFKGLVNINIMFEFRLWGDIIVLLNSGSRTAARLPFSKREIKFSRRSYTTHYQQKHTEVKKRVPFLRRRKFACHAVGIDASVSVEFALLGGCVISLILETMQVGLYGYQSAALSRATYKASRMIKTGAVASQGLNQTQFLNLICSYLPSGMSCSNLIVNVQTTNAGVSPDGFYKFVTTNYSNTVQPPMDNSKTNYNVGATCSFVYLQTYYEMPAFSPAWRMIGATTWNNAPAHLLSAQVVFRNEPYAPTGPGC